jgi:hypothetical protein
MYTHEVYNMRDIFDNTIICRKCNKAMKPCLVSKNGFNLRAVKCNKCGEIIVHPADKSEYENFIRLKEKDFNVKMRMVGNSYAVSIPREIVDFMKEQESRFNDMVKLSFDQLGKVSLMFNSPEALDGNRSRVVSSKEVRIIRNGKPVLHAKKVSDSAHPERNQTKVFKSKDLEDE